MADTENSEQKELWRGDGWKIVDTDVNRPDRHGDSRIIATHIDCPLNTEQAAGGEFANVSWLTSDELYHTSDYHLCFGCHTRVPDSVLTLMIIYIEA